MFTSIWKNIEHLAVEAIAQGVTEPEPPIAEGITVYIYTERCVEDIEKDLYLTRQQQRHLWLQRTHQIRDEADPECMDILDVLMDFYHMDRHHQARDRRHNVGVSRNYLQSSRLLEQRIAELESELRHAEGQRNSPEIYRKHGVLLSA